MGNYEVAVYHWSNWHPYVANDVKRGKGWTEWEYLKSAIPRFTGHRQPRKPLWGYIDDSKPENAELQINTAAEHGITSFIFVWGWSQDDGFGGHGNNLALEKGFLNAANRNRLNFGLMWCGGWCDEAFDYIIANYFSQPNYLRVDGRLYISIYQMDLFMESGGGLEKTSDAIRRFRDKTRKAGLGEIHFAAIEMGLRKDINKIVRELTIDSVTSYAWCHNALPKAEIEGLAGYYKDWARDAMKYWPEFAEKFGVPYYPSVSIGWDPSPRCPDVLPYKVGGPLLYHCLDGTYEVLVEPYLSNIVIDNNPELFREALIKARDYMEIYEKSKMVTIYAWNEWTEGSNLEPDDLYGMGYLKAIKDIFG
jgi:hypothetical protein